MRLAESIVDYQLTGDCKIDIDKAIKSFGKSSIICNFNPNTQTNTYRLYNKRAGVKIQISENDARQLISRLNLKKIQNLIFANTSTFLKLN